MSAIGVDLLIVGAGPVGLFGAYYAGVRGLTVAVVDSLSQVGGQVSAMYPEKQIFDVAGFPAISGRQLISNLAEQAAPYDPLYLLGQEAQQLDRVARDGEPDLLVVKTSAGVVDWARMLQPIASSLTLVHRREAFRAHHGSVEQLRASCAQIVTNAQVVTASGSDQLESIEIAVAGQSEPRRLACQKLVAALGFTAN